MKKIIYYLFTGLALIFINQNINAQSFEKGSINFDVGIGFSAFGTSQTTTQEITIGGVSTDTSWSDTDGAATLTIPINFEYGVTDKIGLGADLTFNNYIIDEEDKDAISSVKAFDFGIKFNYHFLNSDKNDLMIGLGLGISSFTFDFEPDPFQTVDNYSGTGIYWSIGITDRFFFSDHIGVLFNLSYRGYSYSALEADFTSEVDQIISSFGIEVTQEIDWTFNGVNIGTGLAIKF